MPGLYHIKQKMPKTYAPLFSFIHVYGHKEEKRWISYASKSGTLGISESTAWHLRKLCFRKKKLHSNCKN